MDKINVNIDNSIDIINRNNMYMYVTHDREEAHII